MILYSIHLSLSDLLDFSMILSRSIHVAANGIIPFIFMAEKYSLCIYIQYIFFKDVVYIYIFFIHSSVDGHLGHFPILGILNRAAINIRGAYMFSNYSFAQICAQEWDCWVRF